MVRINGFVYIIIGGAIAFFSNLIYNKTGTGSILLFFYVGLLFIAVGFFKVVSSLILGKKEKEPSKIGERTNSVLANMINKDMAAVDIARRSKGAPPANSIVSCPRCGTRHYATSNFCHKCGMRLR